MKSNKIVTAAYILGASTFYSLLIVFQKKGLNEGIEPLLFSFSRSVFVVLFSLSFYSTQIKNVKLLKKTEFSQIFILGLLSAFSILLLFFGQDMTSAINAGFLTRLTPLFVIPFSFLLLGEKASSKSILFLLIMITGTFLLISNGTLIVPHNGDLFVILAAGAIAFQNVFAKKIMTALSIEIVIFCRICLSSLIIVIIIPLIVCVGGSNDLILDSFFKWNNIEYSVISGIFYFLSVLCQYNVIKRAGPFLATTFFLSGSLFSALFAYLLLGETLSLIQWVGALGIIAGGTLLVKEAKPSKTRTNKKPERKIEKVKS